MDGIEPATVHHHGDAIPWLEHEVVPGEELEVAAPHPGHHRAEAHREVQLGDRAGGEIGVGDGQARELHQGAVVGDVPIAGLAQLLGDGTDLVRHADGDHLVPLQQVLSGHDHAHPPCAAQVGEAHQLLVPLGHIAQVHRALHAHRGRGQAGAGQRRGVLASRPGAAHHGRDQHDPDDHTDRVAEGVPDRGAAGAGEAGSGIQRRGGGERTGEQAQRQVPRQSQHLPEDEGRDRGQDGAEGRGGQQRELTVQGAEEGGACGDADGVDEQGQAEGLDDLHAGAEVRRDRGQRQTREQRAGGAEADPAEGDRAEHGARGDDQEQREERAPLEGGDHGEPFRARGLAPGGCAHRAGTAVWTGHPR